MLTAEEVETYQNEELILQSKVASFMNELAENLDINGTRINGRIILGAREKWEQISSYFIEKSGLHESQSLRRDVSPEVQAQLKIARLRDELEKVLTENAQLKQDKRNLQAQAEIDAQKRVAGVRVEKELAERVTELRIVLDLKEKEIVNLKNDVENKRKNISDLNSEVVRLARELNNMHQRSPQGGLPSMSIDEISAIRRAMAKLHHPDIGGDGERQKLWNAFLDAQEKR